MISSNDSDSSHALLASQMSQLALTKCSLADLAAAVRRAVAAIGHGANQRCGARKVFLAAVHAALGGEGAIALEAFKRRMVTAHRVGLLVLAHADFVAAMPRAAAAASEVTEGGAEFHFVLDDAARDPWVDDAASPALAAGHQVRVVPGTLVRMRRRPRTHYCAPSANSRLRQPDRDQPGSSAPKRSVLDKQATT